MPYISRDNAVPSFFNEKFVTKDAAYTITRNDYGVTFLVPATAARVLTLPAVSGFPAGFRVSFINTTASNYSVAFTASSGELMVAGSGTANTSISSSVPGGRVDVVASPDSGDWIVINTLGTVSVS